MSDFCIRCRRADTATSKQPNWGRSRRRRPDNYHDYIRTLWVRLEALTRIFLLAPSCVLGYAHRDVHIHFSQRGIYLFGNLNKKKTDWAVWEMEPPPPSLCNVVTKRDLCVKTFSDGKGSSFSKLHITDICYAYRSCAFGSPRRCRALSFHSAGAIPCGRPSGPNTHAAYLALLRAPVCLCLSVCVSSLL